MTSLEKINLVENPAVQANPEKYMKIRVSLDKIVKSWRQSLFSFEWLLPDGSVRAPDEMIEKQRLKYEDVLHSLQNDAPLFMPILGIGVMDNIEIGSARENLLTLYTQNIKTLDVHILKMDEEEFTKFLVK